MENVVLVVHLVVALAMILMILIQRTAQDGGGLTGGGGTMGGVFTARGGANALSRATAILAGIFIMTSLLLTYIASQHGGTGQSQGLIQSLMPEAPAGSAAAPAVPAPEAAPAAPGVPAVPMSK